LKRSTAYYFILTKRHLIYFSNEKVIHFFSFVLVYL
jgi:hypothetical protein